MDNHQPSGGQHNIQAIYPLSPLQEGILFHCLKNDKSGVYFQQYHFDLKGQIDSEKIQKAWQQVLDHHDVLRTLFTWENRQQPLQLVRHQLTLPWQSLDWQPQSSEEQQQQWQSLLQRDRDRGFDLSRAPLMRITLIRLAQNHYRLLWSFHHLILDGWSQRLLMTEFQRRYHGLAVSPVTTSFGQYIQWLKAHQQQQQHQAQQFWKQQLKGIRRATNPLSVTSIKQSSQSCPVSNRQTVRLDPSITQALSFQARQHRLTLNSLICGAWALVLKEHQHQAGHTNDPADDHIEAQDVLFGTTFAGRPLEMAGIDEVAGLFINTLPLRVSFRSSTPLSTWLSEIQSRQLKMNQYQHTPLTEIQRCSELPPHTALFDSMVVFENLPQNAMADTDKGVFTLTQGDYVEYSHYGLALLVVPGPQLTLYAVHDPRRISNAAAQRLLAQLKHILSQMSQTLQCPAGQVTVMPPAERQLLSLWARASYKPSPHASQTELPGSTASGADSFVPLHHQFEQQAQASPEAIALVDHHARLTYGQLNQQSNQLAQHLATFRAIHKLPQVIGVFLERSIDAVTAILAILKSGAAYVMLDPELPPRRLAQVMDTLPDSAPLIVTRQSYLARLNEISCSPYAIDQPSAPHQPSTPHQRRPGHNPDHRPDQPIAPADLAYIIFTSGSTGQPKGVMISHDNLYHSTRSRQAYYPTAPERFLLLSSLSTDSAVAGLFWSLSTGSTLLLPPPRIEQDLSQLSDWFTREQVSHTLCLPSLYQILLECMNGQDFSSLKAMIVAGEACPPALIESHFQRLDDTELYNEYGPSEATVWATVARLCPEDLQQTVPIGHPNDSTELHLLDEKQQPVLIGAIGEIYLAGPGIAAGYLNATKQNGFVPAPESFPSQTQITNASWYKTGDLARYRDDGRLEFIGRADQQLKIRGYRVEPADIEHALCRHETISDAAVALVRQPDDDPLRLAQQLAALDSTLAHQLLHEISDNHNDSPSDRSLS